MPSLQAQSSPNDPYRTIKEISYGEQYWAYERA